MSAAEPSARHAGPIVRAAGMLLRPAATLDAAAQEPVSARELWLGHIVPLAAIGPLCGAVGLLVFGASIAGIPLKPAAAGVLAGAVVGYGLDLVAVWLLALVVSALAPLFGGAASRAQALKLVALSGTGLWLSGVFGLYPTLGFPMAILGALHSLYALYLGITRLMRPRPEQALACFGTVVLCAIVLGVALRVASGMLV